jgi:hypothetical protein
MSEPENTPAAIETPEPSDEGLHKQEIEYRPRPARPFKARGGSKKNRADLDHEYYLQKREGILTTRHREYTKKVRTPEERALSKMRMSAAKKQSWKKMLAAKKQNVRRALDAGRAVQLAKFAERRPAWKIIKARLEGALLKEIAAKNGTGLKPIRLVVHSVDLPEGKRYFCDRSRPFTRGSGTEVQKSLGFTMDEFAVELGIRKRRVAIWLTNPTKNLDPSEARGCIKLRNQQAEKFLDEKTIRGLSFVDRYDRAAVLATLFPRLKAEYRLLLDTIPAIRAFLKQSASDCQEEELANFVIERAQEEKRGELPGRNFLALVRWLPQLMPWLLENQSKLKGSELARLLVTDLLAFTCSCSDLSGRTIIGSAVSASNAVAALEVRRIRDLRSRIRGGLASAPALPRKKYRHAESWKPKAELFRSHVQATLPTFRAAFRELRQAKRAAPLNSTAWRDRLRQEKHSDAEIDAVFLSKTAEAAAIRCAAIRQGLNPKTAQNLYYSGSSKTKSPKK